MESKTTCCMEQRNGREVMERCMKVRKGCGLEPRALSVWVCHYLFLDCTRMSLWLSSPTKARMALTKCLLKTFWGCTNNFLGLVHRWSRVGELFSCLLLCDNLYLFTSINPAFLICKMCQSQQLHRAVEKILFQSQWEKITYFWPQTEKVRNKHAENKCCGM